MKNPELPLFEPSLQLLAYYRMISKYLIINLYIIHMAKYKYMIMIMINPYCLCIELIQKTHDDVIQNRLLYMISLLNRMTLALASSGVSSSSELGSSG